jgi:hypothetical protein
MVPGSKRHGGLRSSPAALFWKVGVGADFESFANHQHEMSPVAPGLWAVQTVQRARRASALETSADPQTQPMKFRSDSPREAGAVP